MRFLILTLPLVAFAYDNAKMLCLVNKQRAASGLDPLGLDARLTASAQEHSDDQARMGSMTHDGSDGSDPGQRMDAQGYQWQANAENVAYGYGDEEECMTQWMNSPGHRENILGPYTHFGSAVGYSGSTPYYTQDFAAGEAADSSYPECPSGDEGGAAPSSKKPSGKKPSGKKPSSSPSYKTTPATGSKQHKNKQHHSQNYSIQPEQAPAPEMDYAPQQPQHQGQQHQRGGRHHNRNQGGSQGSNYGSHRGDNDGDQDDSHSGRGNQGSYGSYGHQGSHHGSHHGSHRGDNDGDQDDSHSGRRGHGGHHGR